MLELVSRIQLPESKISAFRNDGLLKLDGLFTPEAIQILRAIVANQYDDKQPLMGDMFSRINYDIGSKDEAIDRICDSKNFKYLINSLIAERIFFTQGLHFELEQARSKGFPWHFGLLSFNYIQPDDMAYSIWIPLDEIDIEAQRGGMAYISEKAYSAREDLKKTALSYKYICSGDLEKENYVGDAFLGSDDHLFSQISMEDSFKIGDALIFNRFVWHKSVPLGAGPMQSRRAFVMRFVSNTARYNLPLLKDCAELGHNVYSNYGETFKDIGDNDLISSSEFANKLI